jgi:uncharacterized protein YecE (DUF72 family)
LQKPSSYRHWYEATPDDFIFSVKANRYITHIRRLNNIATPLANFFASGVLELKEKLGPILWQFPPSLRFDPERFETFFKMLPHNFGAAKKLADKCEWEFEKSQVWKNPDWPVRHAIEIRNMSFLNPLFIELLNKYRIALVFADTAGKWPYMEDVTTDFIYLRLHGDEEIYVSGYDRPTLNFWAERIKAWRSGGEPKDRLTLSKAIPPHKKREVFVYFDNDAKVRAPIDAEYLRERLGPNLAA